MNIMNERVVKKLIKDDHLSEDDKKTLLKILGIEYIDNTNKHKIPFSDKISDIFAEFTGSWSCIFIFLTTIIFYIILNSCLLPIGKRFDDYPYVFLNFLLATISALQAPIIMMSQNRQEKLNSLKMQNDYEIDLKTIVIIQDMYSKILDIDKKLDDLNDKRN